MESSPDGTKAPDRGAYADADAKATWFSSYRQITSTVDHSDRSGKYVYDDVKSTSTNECGDGKTFGSCVNTSFAFDFEVESWRMDPVSQKYSDFVLSEKSVVDAGEVGYMGQSGIFFAPAEAEP